MSSSSATTRAALLVEQLRRETSPEDIAGQRRFGIRPVTEQFGLSMKRLRAVAQECGRDHDLALALWRQPVHEARMLAAFLAEPAQLTRQTMNRWVADFDSWAICDNSCMHLFRRSAHAFAMVPEWATRQPEYERRAGFALLATLAVHRKQEPDQTFLDLLPLIENTADDDRNFVRKAVNWALRQIGKRRSETLHAAALDLADDLASRENRTARWIGRDAMRELARSSA